MLKSLNYIITLNKMSMTYLNWTQFLDFSYEFCGKDYHSAVEAVCTGQQKITQNR